MKKWVLILMMFFSCCVWAQNKQEVRDSVRIYFRQSKTDLITTLKNNQSSLDRISDSLRRRDTDSVYRLQRVLVVGGASPEGSVKFNKWLSEKRAGVLFDYLSRYGELPDSLKTTDVIGRDWDGLIALVENDPNVPYRDETLGVLRAIASEVRSGKSDAGQLARIKRLRGGEPYIYMYHKLFPELRASRLYLWYERVRNPFAVLHLTDTQTKLPLRLTEPELMLETPSIATRGARRPFYMDIRTNMLYDALLVPNIGVEFYLGKDWSVLADWMYGWWKRDRSHWYWRAYGGDIAVRKWFGKAAKEKPLTGHHLGVYGQIFTYDFETGGRGYLGGKPGGTLWDKMNYAGGIEYGYSMPVARRINIDFTVGIGYWGGTYHEYKPVDNCYVWQSTHKRHWFGPTKAEVSLVWLIGYGNYNKKGGKR